jgi:hypothetical protein
MRWLGGAVSATDQGTMWTSHAYFVFLVFFTGKFGFRGTRLLTRIHTFGASIFCSLSAGGGKSKFKSNRVFFFFLWRITDIPSGWICEAGRMHGRPRSPYHTTRRSHGTLGMDSELTNQRRGQRGRGQHERNVANFSGTGSLVLWGKKVVGYHYQARLPLLHCLPCQPPNQQAPEIRSC